MDILENSPIIQDQFNLFLYTNSFMDEDIVIQIDQREHQDGGGSGTATTACLRADPGHGGDGHCPSGGGTPASVRLGPARPQADSGAWTGALQAQPAPGASVGRTGPTRDTRAK